MRHSAVVLIVSAFLVSEALCLAEHAQTAVLSPPAEMNLDAFYAKYMDCDGITVISSSRVDDRAFYRVKELLDRMFAYRPELRQVLVDEGFRYIIIAHDEQVTDIPDYAHMEPKAFWNQRARGFGGRTTSCGEENLLNLPQDRYADESIFIHELAHGIHNPGLRKMDPAFQKRLSGLYRQAMDRGLYKNDYASTNPAEYWAESVQAFFDCDRENNWNHNHVNTRDELIAYDPNMAEFVREIFRITRENDWRYKPLAKQPSVQKTPAADSRDGQLPKYVWCYDFSIYGTPKASEDAMLHAAEIVWNMFRYRYDILKSMIDAHVSLVVYSRDDSPLSMPAAGEPAIETCVREKDGKLGAVLPEQMQLKIASSALSPADGRTPAENTLIHDLALAAYLYTGLRDVDPNYVNRREKQQYEIGLERMDIGFDQKVEALYKNAMGKGLWKSTPAAKNRFEYFAQGVQSFFDANQITDSDARAVNTRRQLIQYDPDLASLIEDVFKHPQRYDWRYVPRAKSKI